MRRALVASAVATICIIPPWIGVKASDAPRGNTSAGGDHGGKRPVDVKTASAKAVDSGETTDPPRGNTSASGDHGSGASRMQVSLPAMIRVGDGCCRFDGWKAVNKGRQTPAKCNRLCQTKMACVAANVFVDAAGDHECILFFGFGHNFRVECAETKSEVCFKKNVTLPTELVHHHTTGRCTDDDDFLIWQDEGAEEFHYDMSLCARPCYGEAKCVAACIQKGRGYSTRCAACFGDLASCTGLKCVVPCVSGGEKCAECALERCMPTWRDCAGFDDSYQRVARRRLGDSPASEWTTASFRQASISPLPLLI